MRAPGRRIMNNDLLRMFAVVLYSAVVSALMLKPAVLGGDVDKEPKLLVEEPPAVAILKADLRPIIFLDTNHLGERIATNVVTLQKFKLPNGTFELIFNNTFSSICVGGVLENGDEYIVEEHDMWAFQNFKM